MKHLVNITIWVSLIIQFITTIIPFNAFSVKLNPSDRILKNILAIETIVQAVEFTFYLGILFMLKNLKQYTPTRYFDWFITTPIMLFSTVVFMKYLEEKEKKPDKSLSISDFIKNNKHNIIKLFIYNALMLVFGYLGEIGVMPLYTSTAIGFIFFYLAFKLIYDEYGVKTEEGKNLFWFLGIVWALYGVAAVMPLTPKNISYNFLDVISKNFYGLFIYYKIKRLAM